VQADGGAPVGGATSGDDGRVKAPATGSPEATTSSTLPPAGVALSTTTTTAPKRQTR